MKNFINDIIVSVAYDDINKPNLSEYEYAPNWLIGENVHPKRYLHWLQIDNFLGNQFHTFIKNTTEYFYNSNEKFIYPVVLYSNDLFEKYEIVELNNLLVESIKKKKAKLVFFYITEGWFGEDISHYNWLDRLSIKYKFDKEDIVIITSNLLAEEVYTGDNFTIIPYNYFTDELFFALINKKDEHNLNSFKIKYLNFVDNFKLEKHFLCFNNLSKLHRLWMFYELMNNVKLKDKSILSLNKNTTNKTFYDIVSITNNRELMEYYKTYDSTIGYSYDTTNWIKDVQTGDSINIEAHLKTFVNVITETLTSPDIIFITEKTYKSIYTCQPFIIVGNFGTIKKLKELGFKTFDNWWDESYDNEADLDIRIQKIVNVLEEIASWDLNKCAKVRNEMKEVLVHNYNKMLDKSEIIKFYSHIKTGTKNVRKSIV
jgi:hypothetical protein